MSEPKQSIVANANPHKPKRTPRFYVRVFLISFLLLALFLASALGFGYLRFKEQMLQPISDTGNVPRGELIEFEVQQGWGAARVSEELEARGIVANALMFSLWLRYQEIDRRIGKGWYYFEGDMTAIEVANVLAQGGQIRTKRVVIPEGYRLVDIAKTLHQAGYGREKDVLYLTRHSTTLHPEYVPEESWLEGFLFPASYDFPEDASIHEVLGNMIDRFETEMTPEVLSRLEALGLSVHQWVILASIVQSEAGSIDEMPIIAGVFLNRFDIGMALQSDPTVAYGLGKNLNQLSASAGDFTQKADHAWNTYTRATLPISPISNPGHHALQAILSPQREDENGNAYFYFLHGRDGGFYPNLNLADHNRDVQKYLR